MPDPLERLAGLLRHSRAQPEHGQWLAFERDFGIVFPDQYKNLIDEFGGTSSWFNDSLHVLSPIRGGNYRLREHADRILRRDRESRENTPEYYPFNLFPEDGGVFPWAISDHATFYWITNSSTALPTPVVSTATMVPCTGGVRSMVRTTVKISR
jgi:hypothetical protein